ELLVKRDDCTGLAMGGNKVRQLEFYFGDALAQDADSILITGAVQSNFVRLAAAAARKLGMEIDIQLEARVPKTDSAYLNSGNVLLDKLLGAKLHHYPHGEDEAGADRRLEEIAEQRRSEGKKPYIIHLSPGHKPLGALGYVIAARETLLQLAEAGRKVDRFIVPSGSGATHGGFLFGLRALGCTVPVTGVCVRRSAELQRPRIVTRCREISDLLEMSNPVEDGDVEFDERFLAPGYGRLNPPTAEAIALAAQNEGLLLDPVYSAKCMAGAIDAARKGRDDETFLFLHTGGTPALFAYGEGVLSAISDLSGQA
ncbi:MAG: D-cysteine desulfhydrase family protein, partial [Kiloniellales bacterium]|nr:D-cysteine desulfhydrase family protein [Kiloniellales bacterium]